MTEKITSVSSKRKEAKKMLSRGESERAAVRELVKAARARGEDLTGPDGLLKAITATVLETALEEEMTDHLGHAKHAVPADESGNIRNGTRAKTVLTDAAGQVNIAVPRDRAGTFEPVIIKKRQRRLNDVDAVAISLFAKGLTTGEISAHFQEVYGASVSKDTVSRITDKVLEEMNTWSARPLQSVYAAVFIDAIYVKVGDGQVGNQPFYAAIGVDLNGRRDVLGLWAGTGGGESGQVLDERAQRSEEPRCSGHLLHRLRRPQRLTRFGQRGLPPSDRANLRDPPDSRHAAPRCATPGASTGANWLPTCAGSTPPPQKQAAWAAFEELEEKWGKPYPAIPRMWRAAWEEFTPFLAYDVEIRRVLFSTNAIESLHARFRRAVTVRGHFPTEQAALKCLYLVT